MQLARDTQLWGFLPLFFFCLSCSQGGEGTTCVRLPHICFLPREHSSSPLPEGHNGGATAGEVVSWESSITQTRVMSYFLNHPSTSTPGTELVMGRWRLNKRTWFLPSQSSLLNAKTPQRDEVQIPPLTFTTYASWAHCFSSLSLSLLICSLE
jgi:hypothetical protein